jgi:hypothetical protein
VWIGCSEEGTDRADSPADDSAASDIDTDADSDADSDPDIPVASVLLPFDANQEDLTGPDSWDTNYGKKPEIIVAVHGNDLDVLAQDYDGATPYTAVLLHLRPDSAGYRVAQALTELPMLDRVMGLDNDDAGNRYYATGVDEDAIVDEFYPGEDEYRTDVVRVIKIDAEGEVLFNIDMDLARHEADNRAEKMVNPMVAATSRLAVGGGAIALVHGINTDPDPSIGGTRHQKALSTYLDSETGDITRTESVWVSHSFDQRLLFDGQGIIENHLGDAYPRYVVFAKEFRDYPLLYIKGGLGENNTKTRLGNVALIENDSAFGYIALFATESTTEFTGEAIDGPRNLAIVRVDRSDSSLDESLPDSLTVVSSGENRTNPLRWLTAYTGDESHAERPKLVGVGGDQYVVLWERWVPATEGWYDYAFDGVYGMVIDAMGETLVQETLVTDAHHLHRGDDAFALDGRAAWMTGNEDTRELYLHFVDTSLAYEQVVID